jgi:hypothetical protein
LVLVNSSAEIGSWVLPGEGYLSALAPTGSDEEVKIR